MSRRTQSRNLVDYIIEFIIVLLGITIAFWLSNLGENKKESRLEELYLEQLREDFQTDVASLDLSDKESAIKSNKLQSGLTYVMSGPRRTLSADTIAEYAVSVGNYGFFFTPTNETYLTLQQSGDLKIIKSQELKKKMVSLYKSYGLIENEQKNIIQALDDNFFPVLYESYDMLSSQVTDPSFFRSTICINFLGFTAQETGTLNRLYKYSKRLAQETSDLIALELGILDTVDNSAN